MSTRTAGRDAQALRRAAAPDYFGWLEHTRAAGGCTRPIRLTGTLTAVEPGAGRVLAEQHTDELPDRTLYKACGNRRAAHCPDCAWVYAGDAFQVVRCGRPAPCRARSTAGTCPHGRPAACFARHDADDPQLGRPLCLDCYDHDHQVVWNHFSGELWRRTKQAIERHLTAVCRRRGIPHVQVVTDSGRIRRVPPVRAVPRQGRPPPGTQEALLCVRPVLR